MLYDRIFFVVWASVLSIVLLIFGFERFDISLEQSLRNRSVVFFSSPPLSSFGSGASIVQLSARGVISDAGYPQFTLELISPSPFTQIFVDRKIKRSFMHEGVFSTSFSDFYGSDTGYGILKYSDSLGKQNEILVWFGYPDYDQSSYTIIYQFRAALQDEIPKYLVLQSTNPETILKGQIMDVKLEILVSNNE